MSPDNIKGNSSATSAITTRPPDVLAFFRDTSDDTAKQIIQLNDLYLKNKSRNFKAVAMIIAGESSKQWLEDLSRTAHLEIPLTYFRKGPKDPRCAFTT